MLLEVDKKKKGTFTKEGITSCSFVQNWNPFILGMFTSQMISAGAWIRGSQTPFHGWVVPRAREGRKSRSERLLRGRSGVGMGCRRGRKRVGRRAANFPGCGRGAKSRLSTDFGLFQDLICCWIRHDYPNTHDVIKTLLKVAFQLVWVPRARFAQWCAAQSCVFGSSPTE